ncbi:MAG: hypothetical protein HYS18_05595 [Burkholderiales bacterium]|nr:hypothetical protein [Burkholderiales bacterium]
MSPHRSLAEEKDALLAKMEASRVAYRRMLQGTDEVVTAVDTTRQAYTFPRSKTFRFIRDHPVLTAIAVAVLIVGPRRSARTAMQGGRAIATTVSRNQNRLRIVFGVATTIARFAASRRR